MAVSLTKARYGVRSTTTGLLEGKTPMSRSAWLHSKKFVVPSKESSSPAAPAANDAYNAAFAAASRVTLMSVDQITTPVYVRVNSFVAGADPSNEAGGEATASSYDIVFEKDSTYTQDLSLGGNIAVKTVSIFIPTGATGNLSSIQIKGTGGAEG